MKIWVVLTPDGDYNPIAFDSAFDNDKAANSRAEKLREQYGDDVDIIEVDLLSSDPTPDFKIFECNCLGRGWSSSIDTVQSYIADNSITQPAELIKINFSSYERNPNTSKPFDFTICVSNEYISDDFERLLEEFCHDLGIRVSDLSINGMENDELFTYATTKINKFLDNTIRSK